jgi:predicted permease
MPDRLSKGDWSAELRRRLGALHFSPEREAEIIEELSQHLDDRIREFVAGGAPQNEARRRALVELSDHDLLSPHFARLRQARRADSIQLGAPSARLGQDLWQDVRYALRTARKQPGFTAAAVMTLALGIGANSAIFSLVNATLFWRLPARAPEQLVYVFNGGVGGVFSYPGYVALRDGNRVFDGLLAWGGLTASLNADTVTDVVPGLIITGNFFDLLGVTAARGRLLTAADDVTVGSHPVAVISHQFWQTRFGARSDIVGHEVLLNGHRFTIVGVTPPEFTGPQLGTPLHLYVPMTMQAVMRPPRARFSGEMNPDLLKNARSSWLFAIGRLKPGVTTTQAAAELGAVATHFIRTVDPSAPARQIPLTPVTDGDPSQREQLQSVATLLGSIVGVVLLIACANVANLLLSRTAARRRELAVRLAIGASRWRIVRQLVTESVLLALAGGLVGLGLAWLLIRGFTAWQAGGALPITIDFAIDRRVLLFSFALSLVTGIAFGLVPALGASRPDLLPALKDDSFVPNERSRRIGLKKALVVSEVALSVCLLVVAGLFVRSLDAARAIDPGIDADKLVSMPLSVNLLRYTRAQGRQFYQQVVDRSQALPGVESAAVARVAVLTGGGRTSSFAVEGRPTTRDRFTSEGAGTAAEDPEAINVNVVSPGFFRTLGIGVVRGRDFGPEDGENAQPVAIVSEAAARRNFAGSDPIGQRVSLNGPQGPWLQIVGIVRDSKYANIAESPLPVVYVPLTQNHETGVTLYVRGTVPPASLVGAIRREVQALEPNLPIGGIQTMAETISQSLNPARLGAILISAFGGLALLLAAVGVYGVLSFSIARRTREMGIRVALGADAGKVFTLVIREGMTVVAIGMAIGLAGAAVGSKWLGSFLYTIGPRDPVAFATAPVVLAAVALLACVVPAYRAMRVSPIVALRHV